MLLLYYRGGAQDFEVLSESLPSQDWSLLLENACELLEHRSRQNVAEVLRRLPFKPFSGTNVFGDEFSLIVASVDAAEYARLSARALHDEWRDDFRFAGKALEEVGFPVRFIAVELQLKRNLGVVEAPQPVITSSTVERALQDAQLLLRNAGPISAVDRAHTALHGYLRELCDRSGITYGKDAAMTELFKILREKHPVLGNPTAYEDEIARILRAMATILDSANTLRNRASMAHANETLLSDAEAILAINTIRTILHYIDAKIGQLSGA